MSDIDTIKKDIEIFKRKLNFSEVNKKMQEREQVDCPVKHYYAEGQYAREAFMPAGAMVLGKKHKQSTLNILLTGKLAVFNGEDAPMQELEAPCVYTTEAGVQKLAYIIEDVRWLNCLPTDEIDPDIIENNVTFKEVEKCLT